ncbi:MAG: hypothetical protein LBG60_13125 [Bifidobacteriaceae bacterium]|jgi:predicted transcriptional regulator|nr:hypothetical protein [Bifidobacteriaceae bacterium]
MAQSATTTIRLPRSLHRRLSEFARQRQLTVAAAVEASLEAARREEFWSAVDRQMCTAEARAANQAEAASFDGALVDGLDDESAYWLSLS